jgi:hypothetical protein
MSVGEDADAAKMLLFDLFPFGVATTLKIEPAPVCASIIVLCAKFTPNASPIASSPLIVWNVAFFIAFPFDFDFVHEQTIGMSVSIDN